MEPSSKSGGATKVCPTVLYLFSFVIIRVLFLFEVLIVAYCHFSFARRRYPVFGSIIRGGRGAMPGDGSVLEVPADEGSTTEDDSE